MTSVTSPFIGERPSQPSPPCPFCKTTPDTYNIRMAKKTTPNALERKIDNLTQIVKRGFSNLDTRIEKGFGAIADDIDDLDHKIMSLRATTETGFLSLRDELHEINECLNALDENYKNLKGVTKEIDDIRSRVKDIERHLGINKKIAA